MTAPAWYPALFNAEMVRAILAGTKTQTRRPVKNEHGPDPGHDWARCLCREIDPSDTPCEICAARFGRGPYGYAGDRMWVRENFRLRKDQDRRKPSDDWWKNGAWYEADGSRAQPSGCDGGPGKLRPSIHMPRWASRIDLDVVSVRIERVQDISESDAMAEGVTLPDTWAPGKDPTHRHHFAALWDDLYATKNIGWADNPWVWAYEFRRVA